MGRRFVPAPWTIPGASLFRLGLARVRSLQGNAIAPEHLGANLNFTQDESVGTFGSRVDHVGSEVVSFPGGNVSELYFSPADPNNPIAFIRGEDGGITREEVEPLDRSLDPLVDTGISGLFVIPTSRCIDGSTRFGEKTEDVVSQAGKDEIRTDVRQILDSGAR